ncbi:MAG: response regulator [Desulfarculus sp.]|nr:response regulator [Desulfarculus sp.]
MDAVSVLLVDDEQGFLEAMHKRLVRRGLLVRMAGSGAMALEMLDEHESDVVSLDQKMPEMDGLQTLIAIKARHPRVKVIMLTGHATVDSAVSGMALGAFEYLVKPCDLETLLAQIHASVGRREAGGGLA